MSLPVGEGVSEPLNSAIHLEQVSGVMLARLMMSELDEPETSKLIAPEIPTGANYDYGTIDRYEELEVELFSTLENRSHTALFSSPVRFEEVRYFREEEIVAGLIRIQPLSKVGHTPPSINTVGQSLPGDLDKFHTALVQLRHGRQFCFLQSSILLNTPKF
jgi:hypothetical protein